MDGSVTSIADYANTLKFEDLPPHLVHHSKRCVIDMLGCALGGYDSQPAMMARSLAQRSVMQNGARVIGTSHHTLPEMAAFANGVMARYLDGNDGFVGAGGHPSDTLAAILACADSRCASGPAVITAIVIAYDICYNLWKSVRATSKGIDHSFYITLASAVACAKLLGLDRDAIAHAASLAITANVSLHATRHGHLSVWKGCAGGNAARNGVFAALLAEAGVTGPEKPVEDRHGLQNLVGPFELLPFSPPGNAFSELSFKRFLSFTHGQPAITAALPLSRQVQWQDIEKITVYTYQVAWEVSGKEKEKWAPRTRETADHSIPYLIAAVLVLREFTTRVFSDECLQDTRIKSLLARMEMKADPALTSEFPGKNPCRIEVITKNGEHQVSNTENALGHYNNPMSDDEVTAKFTALAGNLFEPAGLEQILTEAWRLDAARDVRALFDALQR